MDSAYNELDRTPVSEAQSLCFCVMNEKFSLTLRCSDKQQGLCTIPNQRIDFESLFPFELWEKTEF